MDRIYPNAEAATPKGHTNTQFRYWLVDIKTCTFANLQYNHSKQSLLAASQLQQHCWAYNVSTNVLGMFVWFSACAFYDPFLQRQPDFLEMQLDPSKASLCCVRLEGA